MIPHGVDHERFRPPTEAEVAELRQWLGVAADQPYVAFLGTLEPRKNVPALVRAFGRVATGLDHHRSSSSPAARAGTTPSTRRWRSCPARCASCGPGSSRTGCCPALLGGAEIVAYPAHGEGFGLPVLEAMACGAAVLTTDRLSLSEVGGDAVRYARSPDTADLAEALAGLLADPAERHRLGAAGLARSARYTWDATARGHLDVFERVLGR